MGTKKIKNAIIIHGPGRSGTTLFSSMLSLHEDLCWISGYVNKYPQWIELTYLNKLQNSAFFESYTRNKRRVPRPAEAYNFWRYYVPDFDNPKNEGLDSKSIEAVVTAIAKIHKISKKKRFITKLTGNSRWQTLEAIFERPTILWINRNPESVIMSYYKNRWGYKNDLEGFHSKSTQQLIEEYVERYRQYMAERKELERFDLIELQYEDLIANPHLFFKVVCERTNLPFSARFKSIIDSWAIQQDTNTNYRKLLSEDEQHYLKSLVKTL